MLMMVWADGTQNVLGGMLKGMGLQVLASIGTLGTSCFISIPGASLFAFYFDLNIPGLWYGLTAGLTSLGIYYIIILRRSDWNKIAIKAHTKAS